MTDTEEALTGDKAGEFLRDNQSNKNKIKNDLTPEDARKQAQIFAMREKRLIGIVENSSYKVSVTATSSGLSELDNGKGVASLGPSVSLDCRNVEGLKDYDYITIANPGKKYDQQAGHVKSNVYLLLGKFGRNVGTGLNKSGLELQQKDILGTTEDVYYFDEDGNFCKVIRTKQTSERIKQGEKNTSEVVGISKNDFTLVDKVLSAFEGRLEHS